MARPDLFGELLRRFRTRLGDARQTVAWLGRELDCSPSTIYGWENGDLSKGLPAREVVLRIGQLYSLSVQEVNDLLETCGAERKQRARADRYPTLSEREISGWRQAQGPAIASLDMWRRLLESAQTAYLDGELRSSLRISRGMMDEIHRSILEPAIYDLWRPNEHDEMTRLWLLGWRELFESASFLHDGAGFMNAIRFYRIRAEQMAHATSDPVLKAMALHLEGDAFHIMNNPRLAMDHHLEVEHLLSVAGRPFFLTALTQRLILLDGMRILSKAHLMDQVAKARRLADRAGTEPESRHARALLLEAIGRALVSCGASDSWQAIGYAEEQAQIGSPIATISALYTHALALTSDPLWIDIEQLRVITTKGLALAEMSGWERRAAQFRRIAKSGGIAV